MRRNNFPNLIENTRRKATVLKQLPKPAEEEQFGQSRGPCPLPIETWEQPKKQSKKLAEAPSEEGELSAAQGGGVEDEPTAVDAPDIPFSRASRAMFR